MQGFRFVATAAAPEYMVATFFTSSGKAILHQLSHIPAHVIQTKTVRFLLPTGSVCFELVMYTA